jgi:hypothetical protein
MDSQDLESKEPLPVLSSEEAEVLLAWDDPRELRNPVHWTKSKKVFHTLIPCCAAFEASVDTTSK